MENQQIQVDQKLNMVLKHVPLGLAEIDSNGEIFFLNEKGVALLKPVRVAYNIKCNNLFPVLDRIAPALIDKIKTSSNDEGDMLSNEQHSFLLNFGSEKLERHFNFMITKISGDSMIVCFDDITEKMGKEKGMLHLAANRAIVQGKLEIATNVLHDIGNAVVGFGSYLNRIKRCTEGKSTESLHKLSVFFSNQQTGLASIIGEAKAGAAISMLANISEGQKNFQEEINKSITEQLRIINHIQEMLNIQRQYINGKTAMDKKPTNLRSIISDCMSMVFASIEKRGISVSVDMPETLPVINGDRTRLMQVILNLLKNSIEAIDINAEKKQIMVRLTIKDKIMIMHVQDSGTGFDKETGKKLFARGFTTKASGTGLGLDNCRSIIESHDGKIEINSEGFGKGSLATITFNI